MQHTRTWRTYVLMVIIWILGFGVTQLLVVAPVWRLAVGAGDGVFFSGMHAAEAQANSFRWTTAHSTVKLPLMRHGMSVASIRMMNQYPTPDVAEIQLINGTHDIAFQIASGSIRTISLLTQSRADWRWYTPVDIDMMPKQFGDDPRLLGISISHVTVIPTSVMSGVHSVVLIYGLLIGLALGVFGYWNRLSDAVQILGTVSAAMAFYAIVMINPFQFVPYIHWIVWWMWGLLVMLASARLLRVYNESWQIKGIYLPLILVVWWWCMPFIQLVLANDGMPIPAWQLYVAPWLSIVVVVGWLITGGVIRIRSTLGYWPMYLLLAFVAGGYAIWQYSEMLDKGSGDFGIWYLAARRWVFEGELYNLSNIVDNPFAGYKRPPFYIMMFTPFVQMSELDLLNGYRLLNIGLLAITMGLWYRLMTPTTRWWWVVVMVMLINYQPLLDALRYGQTDIVLLFCFTAMWWFVQRGRDGWAGAVIAFLASIKIYPVVLLTFWGIKQRWWALAGFVLGMVGWNAIAIGVMGWDLHVTFLREVLPSIGGTTSWVENQTIAGFLTRFYEDESVMNLFATGNIARIASLISMALSAVVSLTAMRDWPTNSSEYGLQYALFIILMVIAIPVAWIHYATILLLPMLLLLHHYRDREISLLRSAILMVSYGLIAFGDQRSFNYMYDLGGMTTFLSSYKFYGSVLLTGLVLYEVWQGQVSWGARWWALGRRIITRKGD